MNQEEIAIEVKDITKKFNVTEVEGLDHVSFDVIVKNNGKTPLFNVVIFDGLDDFDLFIGLMTYFLFNIWDIGYFFL